VKKRVKPGDTVWVELPWSEACMWLKKAGEHAAVEITEEGAQILNEDSTRYSFPVTHGEAGVYRDAEGLYIEEAE
jgi:hypothetical protein